MVAFNPEEMLTVFCTLETVKEAVQKFESGEINAHEAIEMILQATAKIRTP